MKGDPSPYPYLEGREEEDEDEDRRRDRGGQGDREKDQGAQGGGDTPCISSGRKGGRRTAKDGDLDAVAKHVERVESKGAHMRRKMGPGTGEVE